MNLAEWWKRKWRDRNFRKIVYLFILAKIIILVVGTAAHLYVPAEITDRQIRSENPLLNAWAQYDAGAYLDIAENGYNAEYGGHGNYGWYPLYPLLIYVFSFAGADLAAFLIANVFSFVAVILLYLLVKDEVDKRVAYKTVFYTLFFPTAYFLTAMYTESLFLSLVLASFLSARRDHWLSAGVFGFLASLARMQGVLMFFPLLYMYGRSRNVWKGFSPGSWKKLDRGFYTLFLVPAGTAAFIAYEWWLTGNPLIQLSTQTEFKRAVTTPFHTAANAVSGLLTSVDLTGTFYFSYSLFMLALFLVVLAYSYSRVRREYFIYFLLSMALPLFSGELEAFTRFELVMFPAFMTLASVQNRKTGFSIKVLYAVFIILLVLFTARHVNEVIRLAGIGL